MSASSPSSRPTRRHGLGLRAPAHGDRARAGLAERVRAASTRRRRSPRRSARSIAPTCLTARERRLQAAISRHGLGAGGRPRPAQGSCSRSASASTRRSAPTRSMPRSGRGCARSSTIGREARHVRALSPHAARRAGRACARYGAGAVDRPAADHELAATASRCSTGRAAGQEERDALAINMFRAWYVPFYFYGVIHGDPHLGNYTVRPDGSVNLMDFGCVRVFPPRFVRGSIELYRALHDRRPRPRRGGLRGLGLHRPDAAR